MLEYIGKNQSFGVLITEYNHSFVNYNTRINNNSSTRSKIISFSACSEFLISLLDKDRIDGEWFKKDIKKIIDSIKLILNLSNIFKPEIHNSNETLQKNFHITFTKLESLKKALEKMLIIEQSPINPDNTNPDTKIPKPAPDPRKPTQKEKEKLTKNLENTNCCSCCC